MKTYADLEADARIELQQFALVTQCERGRTFADVRMVYGDAIGQAVQNECGRRAVVGLAAAIK